MKKRIIFIALFMAVYFNAFCEIRWADAEENDEGITAYASCTTKEEVLEVTHWDDLNSHFISYTQDKEPAKQDLYLVIFMRLGTIVYEYHKGTKTVGYYVKTIFE
jgi:hypothetical protein